MQKGKILIFLVLFAPIFAAEHTLIDFTTFNENINTVMQRDKQLYDAVKTQKPKVDIEQFGWPSYSYDLDDWNIDNWFTDLAPSSATIKNLKLSDVKNVQSKRFGNVLGVRLHFHPWKHAFWAKVVMPYFLEPVFTDGTYISLNEQDEDSGLAIGLLANVGQIKGATSWIYGLNFNYDYGVRVLNEEEEIREFPFGNLKFQGWRRLTWENLDYVEEGSIAVWEPVANPLYPKAFPSVKFDSLMFYKKTPETSRNATDPNFFAYVKDIVLEYDYAMLREDRDIVDEDTWGVLAQEALDKKIVISKIIAEKIALRKNFVKRQQGAEAVANTNTAAATTAQADEVQQ